MYNKHKTGTDYVQTLGLVLFKQSWLYESLYHYFADLLFVLYGLVQFINHIIFR